MKMLSRILLMALLLFPASVFSQEENEERKATYNLKGVDSLLVLIKNNNALADDWTRKLNTETKLKLKSAGITLTSDAAEAKAALVIQLDIIRSSMAEHRVIVLLYLLEEANISYRNAEIIPAFTYFDYRFFKTNTPDEIYKVALDNLVLRFIEMYLNQN